MSPQITERRISKKIQEKSVIDNLILLPYKEGRKKQQLHYFD